MRNAILAAATLILPGCSLTIPQFYPDSYFTEDGVYQNKPLRFSLAFPGNWEIETDPNEMPGDLLRLARKYGELGIELLFVGTTIERTHGVKGIAANLNADTWEYAENIRDQNMGSCTMDSGLTNIVMNEKPMVRWDYRKSGYRFAEFFFTLDTYNVHIAFWARPAAFERFLPVYLDIMSSLTFISRY